MGVLGDFREAALCRLHSPGNERRELFVIIISLGRFLDW